MKRNIILPLATFSLALALAVPAWRASAAGESKDDPITQAMQKYHKGPAKGVDPICKRASEGKATKEELAGLLACYKAMAKCKPPRGDDASWKEKTTALIAASEALVKGAPDAAAKYKEAVNCKACHSVHKPEKEKH